MITVAAPTDLDALRLRSEFLAMPGLTITVDQTARLVGVRRDHAAHILDELVHEGFLMHDDGGMYRRRRLASA
jgi:DNA-binding IclR family transcriptional regulator